HLDVLLHVGKELEDFTGPLEVGLVFEQSQRFAYRLLMGANINVGLVDEQDRNVAFGRLEGAHPLEEEQRLEDANRNRVIELPLSLLNRGEQMALEGCRDAFEELIE